LRQLGVAYKIYLADYDQYPDPDVVTHGSFVNDRRILFCPADEDPPRLRAASSYIFTYFVPPDFTPLPEVRNLHPDKVLLICDHHLGPKLLEVESNEDPRVTSPQYPFHLVLRADGRVGRVHLSRIRQLPMPGSRLSFMEVYPGEPGYEQARR
jgi:hypothetical protein